jgi:hypothetical protein
MDTSGCSGEVEVAAIDATASMERIGNAALTELAQTVRAKLQSWHDFEIWPSAARPGPHRLSTLGSIFSCLRQAFQASRTRNSSFDGAPVGRATETKLPMVGFRLKPGARRFPDLALLHQYRPLTRQAQLAKAGKRGRPQAH